MTGRPTHQILVLCYHAVSQRWQSDLALAPAQLAAQLGHLLERGYRGATFSNALARAPAGRTLVVTFDGGFGSVYELARPVLRDLGLPGTVFVTTGHVDRAERAAWPGIDVWSHTAFADELTMMSWDQLGRLADTGWEIGAHSRWHPRLTQLDDRALEAELAGCRNDCEAGLGRPCRSLSYPYGDVNSRVVKAANAAGFHAGAARPVSYGRPSRMEWPRVTVGRAWSPRRLDVASAAARLSLRMPAPSTQRTGDCGVPDRTQFAQRRTHLGGGTKRVTPRVTVVVPCHDDGRFVTEALASVDEDEPVEVVVVDDASDDPATRGLLASLESGGVHVLRHAANLGLSRSRMSGLNATRAPYVFPLDSDDLLIPGALGAMADRLDADRRLAACYGDHAEFGSQDRVVRAPASLEPYRLAFRNEYPVASLFRRCVLEEVGGWRDVDGQVGYEDWHLWMTLAEHGHRAEHLRPGAVTWRRRRHGPRMLTSASARRRELYEALRKLHPDLFSRLSEHRTTSSLGVVGKLSYPVLFGGRRPRGIGSGARTLAARTGLGALANAFGRRGFG